MTFSDLRLSEPLLRALTSQDYRIPTPIQAQAIPQILDGRDLLGVAQTGTGKTAAFALPILQRLHEARVNPGAKEVRALILTPTRELAVQIAESFRVYGRHYNLRQAVVFGGVGQRPQVQALARGVDILVATPGRLMDLMSQGYVRYDRLSVFVLDEADRMLDMGFIRDVRKIAAVLPKQRQTLLFSATMPADIAHLAASILKDPVRVEVTPPATTVERIDQRVLFVPTSHKRALLESLLKDATIGRALVFTRTKHGANKVADQLRRGGIEAAEIHGNKSQSARQHALDSFRKGTVRVLVATDIAARGIDVDGITHVINYDLPNVPESYVHRIGRTARAGADGIALSFCDREERAYLRDIERVTRRALTVVEDHPFAGMADNGPKSGSHPGGKQGARPFGHRNGQGQGHRNGQPHRNAAPAGRPNGGTRHFGGSQRGGARA